MNHSDFTIGEIFWCGGGQWRCTDIGTRVITAIRIDGVAVKSRGPDRCRTLDRGEAEAQGWFNGPPYTVAEHVFDEHAIVGCNAQPVAEDAAS